eukprot:Selendium_serpulae@DN4702_c0_g1_i1.p1
MVDNERMLKDIRHMLAAKCHIGTMELAHGMKRYVGARSAEGVHLINLKKTWEKIQVAARIIVAIENPGDIMAIAMRPYGNRAVLKFAHYVGCHAIAGRWTPGTLTNQITQKFLEPRMLIVTDPRADHRAVKESFYSNVPVIALCDTDSTMQYVDVVIPCNNRSIESIALMYWMLAREVLYLRRRLETPGEWDVMPDLFFYRDPDQFLKPETKEPEAIDQAAPHAPFAPDTFSAAGGDWNTTEEWSTQAPAQQPVAGAGAGAGWTAPAPAGGEQWGAEAPTAESKAKATW